MEFVSKIRWVIVVFVLLFAVIFIGWGLSNIARNLLSRTSTETVEVETVEPLSVIDLRTVSFTVDGPIVASEDHQSYVIEVSERVVTMRVLSNYGQKEIAAKSYTNNSAAYESFVEALDEAGAAKRRKNTNSEIDYEEKGTCPTGKRYILQLGDDERRWTTSCDNVRGNAGGKMTTIRKLFTKQVTDFNELVKGTNLR